MRAENERDVIRERTIAGLASGRPRGRKGGRPPKTDRKTGLHRAEDAGRSRDDDQRGRGGFLRQPGDNLSLGLGSYAKGIPGLSTLDQSSSMVRGLKTSHEH
jgi:DNA invertase Pin-like site-specific DNA recombinase